MLIRIHLFTDSFFIFRKSRIMNDFADCFYSFVTFNRSRLLLIVTEEKPRQHDRFANTDLTAFIHMKKAYFTGSVP